MAPPLSGYPVPHGATRHLVVSKSRKHDRDQLPRSVSTVVSLPEATNDTLALVKAATHSVRKI